MDNNNRQKNANRLVYITVVVIVCVMTVLIGITSALNRSGKPQETSAPESSVTTTPTSSRPTVTSRVTTPAQTTAPAAVTTPSAEQVNTDDELPVFIMPVIGSITKDYDLYTLVYSLTMNDYRVHTGIDLAASLGDAVYCSADGVVEQIWSDPLMGTCMSVRHSSDVVSIYKNLAPELAEGITEGCSVWGGQIIASVGESAVVELADEPHLHFEMKVGGIYADPLDYLPAEAVSAMIATDTSYEDQ